jgi:hypothetical protein
VTAWRLDRSIRQAFRDARLPLIAAPAGEDRGRYAIAVLANCGTGPQLAVGQAAVGTPISAKAGNQAGRWLCGSGRPTVWQARVVERLRGLGHGAEQPPAVRARRSEVADSPGGHPRGGNPGHAARARASRRLVDRRTAGRHSPVDSHMGRRNHREHCMTETHTPANRKSHHRRPAANSLAHNWKAQACLPLILPL